LPLPVLACAIQVAPGQGQRQAGGLDRRHRGVAKLAQVLQRGGGQRQLAEGGASGSGSVFQGFVHRAIIGAEAFWRQGRGGAG